MTGFVRVAAVSGVPAGFVLKRVLVVSPFVLVLAAVTALFEPGTMTVSAGSWRRAVPAGWVAGASILLKFLVSALALLLLAPPRVRGHDVGEALPMQHREKSSLASSA